MLRNELFQTRLNDNLFLPLSRKFFFFLLGFLHLSLFSTDTYAAARSADPELDTVTVVGSRLPSFRIPVADVPANVSFIPANVSQKDKNEIYNTKPKMFQEAVKDVEGSLFFDSVGNGVDTTFGLRGFADSSSTVVLVDGVRMNEVDGDSVNYPLISMDDLESVQVDRGSASPIFGSNAFAGVVHITSGRPSEKRMNLFGGSEWSSYGGYRFYQGVSGTLADEWTPLGGDLTYYFRGGRVDRNGFRSNGEVRITNFDIKLAYELPDEQGRVFAGVKHVDDALSNPGALTFGLFQEDDPTITLKPLDGRTMESTIVQFGFDKMFWDNRIMASLLAYSRYNHVDFVTTSITFADCVGGFNFGVFPFTCPGGKLDPDTDLVNTHSRSSELIWQLAYQDDFGPLHNQTLLGMEMRDASNQALRRDFFKGFLLNSEPAQTDRTAIPQSVGLYWRETVNFWKKVIAHVGMRHDWHWLKTTDELNSANSGNRRWNNSSISTGITAKPTKDVDVFFNYTQGFRVPTISEISPFGGGLVTELDPEKSDSYEVGTRIRVKDKAQIKASYFLIDIKDEIVFDSTSRTAQNRFGQNANVGESRRTGVELRVDARPIEEVAISGSYSWTKAYVREVNQAFAPLVDGRSLGLVPEHRLTMGLLVEPFKKLGAPFDGVKVGLNGIFTGKQHPSGFESNSQALLNATGGAGHIIKSYSVWDFLLSYQWKDYEIYFKINNLFDNKYYSRSINATVGSGVTGATVIAPGTYNFVVTGPPREFLLGIKWQWGVVE